MPERHTLEALLLAHLATVEKIVSALARRHALAGDAADDFGSWVKLRLVENDYAVLAKFRGESSLPTYLTVVIAMLYREYRVQQWGRWRPSAAARRAGALAIRLETLVRRDGLSLAQAAQLLRTNGETTLSDRELAALLGALPERMPLRPIVTGITPPDPAAAHSADDRVRATEQLADHDRTEDALRSALRTLPADDRLLLRLRFLEGLSVADIARALSLDQKPLYRRLERALALLRRTLEQSGVTREQVRELVADPPH